MIFKNKPTYDWLVACLGNPGLEYEKTRHNVGFMEADVLAKEEKFDYQKNRMSALLGEFNAGGKRILVIKPQTYMNNSGRAVGTVSAFYKIPTDRIVVVHDDVSLPVGKIRIKKKSSDGGQKGMRDIIEVLGTDDIARIKIGVGQKPHPDYDMVDWVLGKFPKDKQKDLENALERSHSALKEIFTNGIDSAMNKYNN